MAAADVVQMTFGITGVDETIDGLGVTRQSGGRLTAPAKLTNEQMDQVRKDLAILSDVAEKQPDKLVDLHHAIVTQKPEAARLADEVGLTEAKMYAAGGGGLLVVVVVIAVAAALLLESDTPPTTSPDGGADAGTG